MNAQMTRIADCAEVLPGYALKVRAEHEPEGFYQIMLGKHLSAGQPYNYISKHELRITPRGHVEKYRVNAGDVLFVSRGSRNKAAVVESVPEPTIASSTFYILHPHEGIDPGYLAWCLNQAPVQAQIGQVRTGAGTPIVQRRIFAEIRIPVPSLDQQRKLAVMGGLMAQELRIRNRLVEESKKLHCALGQRLLHNLTSGN